VFIKIYIIYMFYNQTGWLVGMTSYRRDGRIVKEAIDDINILRDYVVDKIGIILSNLSSLFLSLLLLSFIVQLFIFTFTGEPSLCILEGRSMGGAIVTLISERYPERYQGIVAIGAALLVEEKENPIDFTYKPVVPLLFLTNQSELGPIQDYMKNCRKLHEEDKDDTVVQPALWEVGFFSFYR
jgi:hypothetical protein